ncbi:hypothetical protein N7510_009459 [Penicillium lagena]|uniref:uncharacterized protein n=1 Tax=Penicillium lagena TaxID=94218 RepID=UPI0025425CFF|nr:uncharacterized protein N7510_009459 [Penicillium lagena]KAJ5606678.1 hypothetical protein N7510_009459 [Penicillium lagena]
MRSNLLPFPVSSSVAFPFDLQSGRDDYVKFLIVWLKVILEIVLMAEFEKVDRTASQEIEDVKAHHLSSLKLDSRGIPLVPQPSDHKDDPLLSSSSSIFLTVGAGMVPPTFGTLAKKFDVTSQQASYLTTVYILFTGIIPLFVTPFVNCFGRRSVYLLFTLIVVISNIGSAKATTYAGMIVSRCFVGVGSSVTLAFGGATICDMFFQGERGKFIGIYALALTNGPHFGPIVGGYIALNLGYQWIFYINAIIIGAILLLFVVSFPETLFSRTEFSNLENRSYWQRFTFSGKVLDQPVRLFDFLNTFRMLKYWAIIIPCVYYMTANTYGSLVFVLTASDITEELYHFNTGQTGLLIGVPLSIGCLIGESCTGWFSDWLAARIAKRHDGYYKAEVRLWLAPLALFLPIGLIIHGVCVQAKQPWISLAAGEMIASIGVQAATTLTYSYCIDCYKPQAAEVSTIINLFRFVYAFTIGFYALPFAERVGFGSAWGTLAAINFAAWLLLLILIFKGESIRSRQGEPTLHRDL